MKVDMALEKQNKNPNNKNLGLRVISPGGNTSQSTDYTATYLPSCKLSKSDEPDMQDTAGEAGTSS